MPPTEFFGSFATREEMQMPMEGEGVSRPIRGTETKGFHLSIKQQAAPAMRVVLRAEDLKSAMKYAHARWPDASIELTR